MKIGLTKKIFILLLISIFAFNTSCVTFYHNYEDADKCRDSVRIETGTWDDLESRGLFVLYDLLLDPFYAAGSIIANVVTLRFLWDHRGMPFAGLLNTLCGIGQVLPFYHHEDEWTKWSTYVLLILASAGSSAFAGTPTNTTSSRSYQTGSNTSQEKISKDNSRGKRLNEFDERSKQQKENLAQQQKEKQRCGYGNYAMPRVIVEQGGMLHKVWFVNNDNEYTVVFTKMTISGRNIPEAGTHTFYVDVPPKGKRLWSDIAPMDTGHCWWYEIISINFRLLKPGCPESPERGQYVNKKWKSASCTD